MGLTGRPARQMARHAVLLFTADPGPALLEAARLYDPDLRTHRASLGIGPRIGFSNGVLLVGPIEVTPRLAAEARLPEGTVQAWYADSALQSQREERLHEEKIADGERLIRALAVRLGGTTRPARLQPELALLAEVYSTDGIPAEQVIETLRPFAGDLTAKDSKDDSGGYFLDGKRIRFAVSYFAPATCWVRDNPPALGARRKERLHRWSLLTGVRAAEAPRELCTDVGAAAFALAEATDGCAVDMFGFPVAAPEDLLPR